MINHEAVMASLRYADANILHNLIRRAIVSAIADGEDVESLERARDSAQTALQRAEAEVLWYLSEATVDEIDVTLIEQRIANAGGVAAAQIKRQAVREVEGVTRDIE